MKKETSNINMHIVYISFHCSEKLFETLFKRSKIKPGQAVQKYNRLLAEGLAQVNGASITAITECPITVDNYDKKTLFPKKESVHGINYKYLPLINIHRIKDLLSVVTSFLYCLYFYMMYPRRKVKTVAISDALNAPVAFGSLVAAKLCRVKYYTVITDIPDMVYSKRDKIYLNTSNYIIKHADGYVLLTQQMNEYIGNYNKKYAIIEGLVDIREQEMDINYDKSSMRVCMYTGLLDRKYGISDLVQAFINATLENTELHIYGDGEYAVELREIARQHQSIKYYGAVLSSYVVQEQKKATLLINPRPTYAEYTRYSFPSKNMEYMVSGTPVLTTDLPGMPSEYREYVYLFREETVDGYCNSLKEVLGLSDSELRQKGMKARKFVLNCKNNITQAQKVMRIL